MNIEGILIYSAVVLVLSIMGMKGLKKVFVKMDSKLGEQLHRQFVYRILQALVIFADCVLIGYQIPAFKDTISTLLASSGVVAIVISLAAQESMTNLIDGIFISVFKPFNIGDRVSLPEKNDITGIVTAINLRQTVITTYKNTSYIISNAQMSNAIIENSNFKNDMYSTPIDVQISYDSDLDLAMNIMKDVIINHEKFVYETKINEEGIEEKIEPTVLCREFKDSGIELRCVMNTANVNESFKACSDVRIAIKKAFDENHIVIPFQTITVLKQERQ